MSQADKQRLIAILEERKSKVLSLEVELAETRKQLNSIDLDASAAGGKSGSHLSEYASFRKKLSKSFASVTKKLADAKKDLDKAVDRLNHD